MPDPSKTYNPKEVEEKWLKIWFENKIFKTEIDPNKKNFSIALPPPNITGNLHMGHALNAVIQDALIRYHKMNGENVLWQGGTDHAGIATQVLVERNILKNEKKRKEDLGRQEFLKHVWAWREKHGNEIIDQLKSLGCFLDYERLVFTMDENYTKAIKKVFVNLYKEGLIYRGKRIVNWCPRCLTSLSDLELEEEEKTGKLYHILYPFDINNISKGGVTVATTRPETMFGDVAVCVHPEDIRYKKLVGEKIFLPLINKQIPIISDKVIKMEFGTGAVKTTPAHDANDFEIFERCKELKDVPVIMSPHGKIQDENNLGIPKDIVGLDRFDGRKITLQKLEELGLLKEVSEYSQLEEKHDRCGTIIEPYLSKQWFVSMTPLAKDAVEVVEEGKIKFIPERYKEHYLNWLKNIKDWCISRQLWWGHQIPVWYHKKTNEVYVEESPPKDIENYTQDPDVLDTWFSSALWPFVTLSWPNDNEYLRTFFPTSVLSTARDIINLWVSRMIFMSLKFTKKIPFTTVIIHPVLQTPDGKRMSKSKGNAIDPLEMIKKYGCDANRFWYFSLGVLGNQDVRFPGRKDKDMKWESDTLEQYKRFANKLWNAVRFVLQNIESPVGAIHELPLQKLTIADKWILHKYTELLTKQKLAFEEYQFTYVTDSLYRFIWNEFCDWYIEISKRQLTDPNLKEQTQTILFYIVEGLLRTLHPIMPFITEEIWQTLQKSTEAPQHRSSAALEPRSLGAAEPRSSIVFSPYPKPDITFLDAKVGDSFSHVIETTQTIRNLRQTAQIPWTKEIDVRLFCQDDFERSALVSSASYLSELTKSKVSIYEDFKPVKPSTGGLVSKTRILIPLSGLVDPGNMLNSLSKRRNQFEKDKLAQESRLKNKDFVNNAPQDKIDEVRARVHEIENQIKTIDEQIGLLK